MPRHHRLRPGQTVIAEPYDARQCPFCKVWIFTAAGPFAEGDPTKTFAEILHIERQHPDLVEGEPGSFRLVPFCDYNEEPVEAIYEGRKP